MQNFPRPQTLISKTFQDQNDFPRFSKFRNFKKNPVLSRMHGNTVDSLFTIYTAKPCPVGSNSHTSKPLNNYDVKFPCSVKKTDWYTIAQSTNDNQTSALHRSNHGKKVKKTSKHVMSVTDDNSPGSIFYIMKVTDGRRWSSQVSCYTMTDTL